MFTNQQIFSPEYYVDEPPTTTLDTNIDPTENVPCQQYALRSPRDMIYQQDATSEANEQLGQIMNDDPDDGLNIARAVKMERTIDMQRAMEIERAMNDNPDVSPVEIVRAYYKQSFPAANVSN